MKRLKRLMKNNAGFTLGEVLACMLILLLVTGVVVGALPVAYGAFKKVVNGANSQVLLSSTVTALRDELSTAGQIEVPEKEDEVEDGEGGGEEDEEEASPILISYRSSDTGSLTRISQVEGEGFVVEQYVDTSGTPEATRLLVSREASTGDLYATCSGVTYENGTVIIHDLIVTNGTEEPLASAGDVVIHVIDPT